ncbi:MAG TPA: hypothetical protein VGL04_12690 [Sporichthyaceae bacterium]
MPYYRCIGELPPKRHTQFRRPDGRLYHEELMGAEGFSSDSALLYHAQVPSAVVASRVWELPEQCTVPNHPLRPRHLRLHVLAADGADAVTGRQLVLGNGDVRISYVVADVPSPLYRNAIGDECVFVEAGSATVQTVFGTLSAGPGDTWSSRGGRRTGGCRTGRCGSTPSRPTRTSPRPSGTCPRAGSSWSTRRTASAICARRRRPCWPRAPTSRCT